MKSEHRHELKTNELRRFFEKVGPFFEKYGNQLLLGLAVIVLVVGGTIFWVRSSTAATAAGWTEMAACRTAEDFANLADNYPQSPVAAWARLKEAETHLQNGVRLSFQDREAALSDLKKSRESFETLLNSDPLPDAVRERGLFGLARCWEALSDSDTSQAVAAYKKLIRAFPQSIYRELAEKRIADLNTGSTQQFYAWFQAQNPKPEDRETPQDGLPQGHPPLDPFNTGPGEEEISLPEIPDLLQLPEKSQSDK